MKSSQYLILFLSISFVVSCTDRENNAHEKFTGQVIESEKQKFGIDTVATGLQIPWGMAFLPDRRILVTERAGEIRIIKDGKLSTEKLQGVPAVFAEGQGGLLDITLHPDYDKNGWIYFAYSKPGEGGGGTTITRAKLTDNTLTDLQELFSAQPFTNSGAHFGCRIVFDGEGHMFFSSGERGTKENAQNLGNHLGKILRLNDDGTLPSDNPFVNTQGAMPEIWSYGNRNPQGLVYDKETKTLWAVEHGPMGGDELNIIEKGKNYGWPVITYGKNYDGSTITDIQQKDGMEQPVRYWVPSIAVCGMAQVKSKRYPGWKNNFLVAALAHTHVARVEVENGKYIREEKLLDKIGRVRMVKESPDGYIYVATESPGMLLRLVPVD